MLSCVNAFKKLVVPSSLTHVDIFCFPIVFPGSVELKSRVEVTEEKTMILCWNCWNLRSLSFSLKPDILTITVDIQTLLIEAIKVNFQVKSIASRILESKIFIKSLCIIGIIWWSRVQSNPFPLSSSLILIFYTLIGQGVVSCIIQIFYISVVRIRIAKAP